MRFYSLLIAIFVILLMTTTSVVFAAPGDLDPTFDNDGLAFQTSANSRGITAVAYQPDGKIITCAIFRNGSGNDWIVITRYLSDGQLDLTFNSVGERVFMPENENSLVIDSTCEGLDLQSDGKIIFGGDAIGFSNGSIFIYKGTYLGRVNPDGTLDTNFGTNGYVFTGTPTFEPDPSQESLDSIIVAPDDTIITSGEITAQGNAPYSYSSGAIWKYHTDGTRDRTFASNGVYRTAYTGFDFGGRVDDLVVESNGKISGAGTYALSHTGQRAHFIVRLNPDGTYDTTLDGDGFLRFVPNGYTTYNTGSYIREITLDQAGNYVVAAGLYIHTGNYVFRLFSDGTFDTSFGANGTYSFPDFTAKSIRFQSDGAIVLGGDVGADITVASRHIGVARLLPDGTRDTTFGSGGITGISSSQGGVAYDYSYSYDILIQPDNKVVVTGGGLPDGSSTSDPVGIVARFDLGSVPTAIEMNSSSIDLVQNQWPMLLIIMSLLFVTTLSIRTRKRSN